MKTLEEYAIKRIEKLEQANQDLNVKNIEFTRELAKNGEVLKIIKENVEIKDGYLSFFTSDEATIRYLIKALGLTTNE